MSTSLFEVTALGFNGATDSTDDRILWVAAPTLEHLLDSLEGVPHLDVDPLPDYCAKDVDYRLPGDVAALVARLKGYAA